METPISLSLSVSVSIALSTSSASCWRAKDSLAVQPPSSARRVISPSQTTGNIASKMVVVYFVDLPMKNGDFP